VFLLVLRVFADFDFTSSKHVIRRCFLGRTRSKKIAKEAQHDPTQGKYADQNMHQNAAFGELESMTRQEPP